MSVERLCVAIGGFLDWVYARVHRPGKPRPQPGWIWQRPDLIDPPLRPLPASRPRRLTNTRDSHDQIQSALIASLPAEVRVLIWEHVIGPKNNADVLHIELADGILRHNRCYERDSELPVFQHNCWGSAWRKSFRVGGLRGRGEPMGFRRAILPLLFTCKLIYTESVDLLYSTNTFDFRRTDSVIRLTSVMLPHRMQQLRRVQISTAFACYHPWHPWDAPPGIPADFWKFPDDRRQWPAACEILASLRHLQYARISIFSWCQLERHSHSADAALLEEILQPLKSVHAVEFIVEITEPLETVRERLGATPFRLMEREKPVCLVLQSVVAHAHSLPEAAMVIIRAVSTPSCVHGASCSFYNDFVEQLSYTPGCWRVNEENSLAGNPSTTSAGSVPCIEILWSLPVPFVLSIRGFSVL